MAQVLQTPVSWWLQVGLKSNLCLSDHIIMCDVCVPGLETLHDVLGAVYCTYPVPLHAHTHFLATVWAALVLHCVRSQTLAAPLLLTGLRLAQHLSHALLVHIVQTLTNTQCSNKRHFT